MNRLFRPHFITKTIIPKHRFITQTPPKENTATISDRIYSMIKRDMDNRQKKYTKWFGGILTLGGGCLWYFYPELSQKTAKIASETLADQKVHQEAHILATETLKALANDPNAKTIISDFFVELIGNLSYNNKVQNDLSHLIVYALKTPEVKEVTKNLVIDLTKDEVIRKSFEELVVDVAKRNDIKEETGELIKESLIKVLTSKDFQETADKEVSGVLYRLVTPRWFQKKDKKETEEEITIENNL